MFGVYRCVQDELSAKLQSAAAKYNAVCQCVLNNSLVMKRSLCK